MDSRHEMLEQETFNHLIDLINEFIQSYSDEVLKDKGLLTDIKCIADIIYSYAQPRLNIENHISKRNILSIDVVHLPHIEIDMPNRTRKNRDYGQVLRQIQTIVDRRESRNAFYGKVREVLESGK